MTPPSAGPGTGPVTVQARILEALPNGLYRLGLGPEGGGTRIQAHLSPATPALRVRAGDLVDVQLMAYDASRGRIVKKHAGNS